MAFRFRLVTKYAAFIVALVGGALVVSGGTSLYFAFGESKQALFALQREKADAAAYQRDDERGVFSEQAKTEGHGSGGESDEPIPAGVFDFIGVCRARHVNIHTRMVSGYRHRKTLTRYAIYSTLCA